MPTKQTKMIEIPPIEVQTIRVTIQGTSPLLTNRFADETLKEIVASQGEKKASKKRDPIDPQKRASACIHWLQNGKGKPVAAFSGVGIWKCIFTAAKYVDWVMTEAKALIQVPDVLVEIQSEDDWQLFSHFAKPNFKTTVIAHRPRWNDWRMTFDVRFDKRGIGMEQVVNLIYHAGLKIGLGSWRPEKSGTFGTFRIQSVEDRGVEAMPILSELTPAVANGKNAARRLKAA